MSKKRATVAAALICLASWGGSSAVRAQTVLSVTGNASTNSLDQTTTLGSAELRLQGKGVGTVKLVCGILGQIQALNPDGSRIFRHTVACDDHSLFILTTHTVITPQGGCPVGLGIVGTFHEDSTVTGVVGPFSGSTGKLRIDGTINCGFNEMNITGSMTRP